MIPNENQSPNVTKNNNSKEFPSLFFQIWWFFQIFLEYFSEYSHFHFYFYFLKKKFTWKKLHQSEWIKATQNHCEITSRLSITLHIIFLCVISSYYTILIQAIHNLPFKNGSYQINHSFIHSTTWSRDHSEWQIVGKCGIDDDDEFFKP
jgi:hypothetical protein